MMPWMQKLTPRVLAPSGDRTPTEIVTDSDGWISVKDSLPEFEVRVLLHSTKYGVLSGRRTSQSSEGDNWRLGTLEYYFYSYTPHEALVSDVTHWMPLPGKPRK